MIIYHAFIFQIYNISLFSYFPLLQKISGSLWQPQRALFLHCPIMCSVCDTIDFLLYLAPRLSVWGTGHAIAIFIVGEAATYEIPPLLAANGDSRNQFSFMAVGYACNDALWSEIRIPESYHVLCYKLHIFLKYSSFWDTGQDALFWTISWQKLKATALKCLILSEI